MLNDFKKFILRGNVIDLAVAVIIGTAFNSIITSLVKDLITPLIAAIGGKPDFSNLYFTLHHSQFMYGDLLNAVISFLILASIIFFCVIQPINKLTSLSGRNKKSADPDSKICPECLSTIPIKAVRCAFCTSKLVK